MENIHWRLPIAQLRKEISDAKKLGVNQITLVQLELAVNNIEANLSMDFEDAVLGEINQTNYKENYEKNLDKYIEYLKTENEIHRQYTQLVISAGYAGYFGLWAIVSSRAEIDRYPLLLDISLLLVTISVISFIFLEVAKIGITGFKIDFKNKALIKAKAEDTIAEKTKATANLDKYDDCVILWCSRIWIVSYPISVAGGLIGLFLLLAILIANLSIFQ
jgi:hypothetical protein